MTRAVPEKPIINLFGLRLVFYSNFIIIFPNFQDDACTSFIFLDLQTFSNQQEQTDRQAHT